MTKASLTKASSTIVGLGWLAWAGASAMGQEGVSAGAGAPAAAAPAGAVQGVGVPGASAATAAGTGAAGGLAGAGGAPAGAPNPLSLFLPLILFLVLMFGFTAWAGKKEKRKRQELLSSIRKGDKVQTAGGIIGVVAELGDDDLVLRLEEGKVRVAKASVGAVLQSSRNKDDGKSDAA